MINKIINILFEKKKNKSFIIKCPVCGDKIDKNSLNKHNFAIRLKDCAIICLKCNKKALLLEEKYKKSKSEKRRKFRKI